MITDTQSQPPADCPAPSTDAPTPPRMDGNIHSPEWIQGMGGRSMHLFALVLPARDLLSGTADNTHIVLELSSYQCGNGPRRTTVGWHGPYPTERAARYFVSQLAKQRPTQAAGPSAD